MTDQYLLKTISTCCYLHVGKGVLISDMEKCALKKRSFTLPRSQYLWSWSGLAVWWLVFL